jgi:gamma-D-glutamyl-L-lysine dipeptidyl-peptidase
MDTTQYGVCRLSIVPVRAEPSHQSEQTTQLLFGDHFEVVDTHADGRWLKICTYLDQYEGWIAKNQFYEISAEFFEYINRAELKITLDVTSSILFNKSPVVILLGSIIPISGSELFRMEEQFAFNGESKTIGLKRDFEYLQAVAYKYLNAPYQWGGKSPFGIDCSGFTQMVFRICGYQLNRDAWQQASQGKTVNGIDASRPGDLAFFRKDDGRIDHVGILLSGNRIIHASGRVRIDTLTEKGIVQADSKALTHNLADIRRILA